MIDNGVRQRLIQNLQRESGVWIGKTYQEMADLLSEGAPKPVSARSVSYVVKLAQKQGEDICPRRRGNPRPSRNGRKSKNPGWYRAVFNELASLTGLSEAKIFLLLKSGILSKTPMSKTTFSNLLRSKRHEPIKPRPKPKGILDRYSLNLHTVCLERIPDHQYWIVLALYEQQTHLVRFKLLEVNVASEAPNRRQRGRPKSAPALPETDARGSSVVSIIVTDNALTCQIHSSLIYEFVDEVREMLHPLAVHQVTVRCTVADEVPELAEAGVPTFVCLEQKSKSSLPKHTGHALSFGKLLTELSAAQAQHNELVAFPLLDEARLNVRDAIKAARDEKKPQVFLRHFGANRERSRIRAHYLGESLVLPKLRSSAVVKISVPGKLVTETIDQKKARE